MPPGGIVALYSRATPDTTAVEMVSAYLHLMADAVEKALSKRKT